MAAWFVEARDLLRSDVVEAHDAIRSGPGRARPFARWESLEVNGLRRGVVLRAHKPTGEDLIETDGGLQRTVDVPLADHSRGVRDFAERFAKQVNLAGPLQRALRTAGYVHDLGKADPRFQARLGAQSGETLAKSARYNGRVEMGERHEVYSVALLDQHPELLADHEEHRDLIRYLIGTHHGFGRGFHPIKEDGGTMFEVEHDGQRYFYSGKPALSALASDWTDLFVDLHRLYGAWGLAYLEAILRLADHRRSELEMEEA
ncbi:MAG: CRISPR-associated endonuclease Cas3'' [Polyangiaceae bacterium]